MRCMFFAILRSRMRSNSESPLKFFSSSFSSSLSFAVAAWCCCPGVVGGENRRIVKVVSLIADIFYFFFLYVPEKRRFFLRFFWRESFLFIFSLFVFSSERFQNHTLNWNHRKSYGFEKAYDFGTILLFSSLSTRRNVDVACATQTLSGCHNRARSSYAPYQPSALI